jgi:uncharacterized protein YkwD
MKTLKFKLPLLVFAFIFLTSCSSEDDGIYFDKAIIETKTEYSNIELEIFDLVNEYRISIGLNALSPLNIVSSVAETHTSYMVSTGNVGHDNFPERQQKLVQDAHAKTVGENVGYGFNSAQGVVNAWLNSEGHKAIIENPEYTHFGISTEQNDQGRNFFTQIFIKR